ncbi:ComEC/Rec2 family competence protein [Sphingomonas faeni]|uniref:ComEC/Rec2 family competence protein n=1 Tax=Sphingomonas faeni TaxID=185950 RepID=UPI00335287E7
MGVPRWGAVVGLAVERWLEAERDQLVLWLPVMLGGGIALWFALPDPAAWCVTILLLLASGLACLAVGQGGRAARSLAIGLLTAALGLGLIWARSESVARPVLGGPTIASFSAKVEAIEPLVARQLVRLTLLPIGKGVETDGQPVALPYRVRVNLAEADAPKLLGTGAVVHLRARLMPPPLPAVPGAYDFARVAWFGGIGATGRGFAPVVVTMSSESGAGIRVALSRHIVSRLEGSAGGIAAALATGDVGAISEEDSEAMRRAGLAHLLSVSGLHITAAVAATMLIVLRLLALSPWLALHARLPLIAALAGAAAAIGYTLLTGSQVPTIRSCVAALLVLAALAMGREAMTLRLVAAGAACVMLVLPESAAGPSFQLSFAAITAIMALHEHPAIRAFFGPHEEGRLRRLARGIASLLLTGLLVEFALMPIAVYHFHKAGLYGAFANIVAIPLTTFVVMPLEALALLLDAGGLGAPIWWLVQRSLDALLSLAHIVADAPGSVRSLPAMPTAAFALMISGGIWIALWRTRWRRLGLIPLAIGAVWAMTTPAPDVLVTGDGRHVAVRTAAGLAMLRDRAGDYTRDMLAENGGVDGEPLLLADQPDARCSRDLCVTDIAARGRMWRILATRSAYMVPIAEFIAACHGADVVVSERGLPKRCVPRWLKLDRRVLRRTGGVALTLGSGTVVTILNAGDRHPWRDPPLLERTVYAFRPHHDRFHGTVSAFRAGQGRQK